jgi:peptidoglycan/xylan/chitin deacetylase (PgdA/CDA1 family)
VIRARLKSVIESILATNGPTQVGRKRVRDRVLILAYHNVLPEGVEQRGERSIHLSLTDFCSQLDELAQHCAVVPLEEVAVDAQGPADGRPRVAITFDDAYRGAVTVAVPALAERQLPATIFVPGGLIGGGAFWWDRVADGTGGQLDWSLRHQCLEVNHGSADRIEAWASDHGIDLATLPHDYFPATEAELGHAVTQGHISLGAHTWRHPNLTAINPASVQAELSRSLKWLQDRFPEQTVPWLAYPYGLENAGVRAAAMEAGYHGALCISGGWFVPRRSDRFALPRLNVSSGLSLKGFEIRVAGLIRR